MEIDALDQLPPSDQWTFLRGRIVEESVELDAALRGLHAQLRGLDTLAALFSAPANWSAAVDQCRTMVACAAIGEPEVGAAIGQAIDEASSAYEKRNRYVHDLLTADLRDELVPSQSLIQNRGEFYLIRLATKTGPSSAVAEVTIDDAFDDVNTLVAAQWKLRAARGYLAGQTSWRTALLGSLEGDWNGAATWTYSGTDDED